MRRTLVSLVAAVLLALTGHPAWAHHPFESNFDWKKPVTIAGTVTDVRWTMPHVILHLDVQGGTVEAGDWTVELGSPRELAMFGWARTSVSVGDAITVDGWLPKEPGRAVNARAVTIKTGQELFGASSFFYLPGMSSFFFFNGEDVID